jgi:hypothetical protein
LNFLYNGPGRRIRSLEAAPHLQPHGEIDKEVGNRYEEGLANPNPCIPETR